MKILYPSPLDESPIKQDSTLACSVAVISTDTAGREDFLVPPRIADDIRDCHFNGSALLFRTRRFKRKNTLSRISNINHASDAEAAKISNIGSCMPERSLTLTLLRSKTVSILAETRLGDACGSWTRLHGETVRDNFRYTKASFILHKNNEDLP